jgi:D-methionine transport system substrate-binding protein
MGQTNKYKISLILSVSVLVIAALGYWQYQHNSSDRALVIGITPAFATQLQVAADEAKKQGIAVKLVEFSDWNTPNVTLSHGDIDANYFQHQPFLDNAKKENSDFKLKAFAQGAATHVGLYSKKYSQLDQLPQQARVVIPNDPVNQGRALQLFQQAQLIRLKQPNNLLSGLKDIAENPKQLQFVEVEGPQTARAIDDVDLAFGYPHYLRLAKTADPNSALVLDQRQDNRYAILFVVRENYQDKDDKLKRFVEIFQKSDKVKAILDQEFGPKLWFPGWSSGA